MTKWSDLSFPTETWWRGWLHLFKRCCCRNLWQNKIPFTGAKEDCSLHQHPWIGHGYTFLLEGKWFGVLLVLASAGCYCALRTREEETLLIFSCVVQCSCKELLQSWWIPTLPLVLNWISSDVIARLNEQFALFQADIVCLQEIAFEIPFYTSNNGFESTFAKRTRCKKDGCFIAWKKSDLFWTTREEIVDFKLFAYSGHRQKAQCWEIICCFDYWIRDSSVWSQHHCRQHAFVLSFRIWASEVITSSPFCLSAGRSSRFILCSEYPNVIVCVDFNTLPSSSVSAYIVWGKAATRSRTLQIRQLIERWSQQVVYLASNVGIGGKLPERIILKTSLSEPKQKEEYLSQGVRDCQNDAIVLGIFFSSIRTCVWKNQFGSLFNLLGIQVSEEQVSEERFPFAMRALECWSLKSESWWGSTFFEDYSKNKWWRTQMLQRCSLLTVKCARSFLFWRWVNRASIQAI